MGIGQLFNGLFEEGKRVLGKGEPVAWAALPTWANWRERERIITHAPCPMPHAPCPMPHAPCPMPHYPSFPFAAGFCSFGGFFGGFFSGDRF
ncbi:MAG: hypothetical protein KME31_06240 [Tolypothrix carrinoi HA7290-LM1]|nr:hypothetical protein [Tolypothrix carrinoi HA7290-LM1]